MAAYNAGEMALCGGNPAGGNAPTAPSFGTIHTRHGDNGRPGTQRARLAPCRPRRDRPTCRHGRPAYCGAIHGDGDTRTGTPLCLDCYDHTAQIAWNACVPKLWTRTIDAVERELRRLSRRHGGTRARLRYAKVEQPDRPDRRVEVP